MIHLTEEQLRAVQLTELEMLKEVDRICRKHKIRYNIIAGTLLGAVRHGGFIPWDDDADIAMLRTDYEKFVKVVDDELDTDRFYFQDHRKTPGYRWGYAKLRRKGTAFVREKQEHMPYPQGIFIDIFPMDYIPDRRLFRTLKNFECFCIRKILWSRVGRTAEGSPLKRMLYSILDRIPEDSAKAMLDRLIARSRRPSGWVRILMFPTPNSQYGYRTRWYAKSRILRFEDTPFRAVKDYDEYLHFKFGDYMTPPPEELRRQHRITEFRLP